MSVIGTFSATREGGWTGSIRTLTIDVKARFVPNDNKENEAAPAFRIFAGQSEIGAAWRKQSAGEHPRDYLSVRFADPALPEPISAALFESSSGGEAQLVWNSKLRASGTPA